MNKFDNKCQTNKKLAFFLNKKIVYLRCIVLQHNRRLHNISFYNWTDSNIRVLKSNINEKLTKMMQLHENWNEKEDMRVSISDLEYKY